MDVITTKLVRAKLAQDNGQKSSYDLKNMMLNLAENFVY